MRTDASNEDIIARYREALRRDPSLDKARLGLADQLRAIRRHAQAATEYAAYLAHRPDDPFEELTKDVTAENFVEKSEAPREEKALGIRRSKRPFEAAKEEEEAEESLRQPEYGKVKRTRRRGTKRT